jgi:two-component system NtrC family sensor kinase
MPDLSGMDLAREMRRVRPELPMVLMSGHSGADLTERAELAGMDAVLRKPLRSHEMAQPIAQALALRRQVGTSCPRYVQNDSGAD